METKTPAPFVLKPWMLILMAVAVLLVLFNVDPVGDWLEKTCGEGADRLGITLVSIGLIVYGVFFAKKKS